VGVDRPVGKSRSVGRSKALETLALINCFPTMEQLKNEQI
jgi:hypothetical protein